MLVPRVQPSDIFVDFVEGNLLVHLIGKYCKQLDKVSACDYETSQKSMLLTVFIQHLDVLDFMENGKFGLVVLEDVLDD
jgi:hypothetical protein